MTSSGATQSIPQHMDAFHRKAHCSRPIGWSCHPLPNTTPPYTDRTNTRLFYKESLKGFLPQLSLANQPAHVATRTRQCSEAFGGGLNSAAAIRKMLGSGLPIGTCCVAASWRVLALPKACQNGHGGGRNGKPSYRVQLEGDLLPRVSVSRAFVARYRSVLHGPVVRLVSHYVQT
jgi:hypothetical protein